MGEIIKLSIFLLLSRQALPHAEVEAAQQRVELLRSARLSAAQSETCSLDVEMFHSCKAIRGCGGGRLSGFVQHLSLSLGPEPKTSRTRVWLLFEARIPPDKHPALEVGCCSQNEVDRDEVRVDTDAKHRTEAISCTP